jgi:hypothetical protein
MKRPSYRAAIEWIAENDDTTWLDPEEWFTDIHGEREPPYSVTAVLVADLFDVPPLRVAKDLQRKLSRPAR